MDANNLTVLIESLEKKVVILNDIKKENAKQAEILNAPSFSFEEFDKTVENKGYLIYKLNKLDDGFETVFGKVKEELNEDKAKYAKEIKKMQDLIRQITDLSTEISAEEKRNKAKVESTLKGEKAKIKKSRSSAKAINSYSQSMAFKNN